MRGSLFGVNSSKKITEEYKGKFNLFFKYFISVIGCKLAWLYDRHVLQGRKSVIVIRLFYVER